jgi:hypothetical protein
MFYILSGSLPHFTTTSLVKVGEVKKSRSEEFGRSSGEARSEVVVHRRSTPSQETSLLAVFLLHQIRLMFDFIRSSTSSVAGDASLVVVLQHVAGHDSAPPPQRKQL